MPSVLTRTKFGNPVLRAKAKRLTTAEILSETTQLLIADMFYTLEKKPYGVGLAAPQVGKSVALSVIGIKSTPTRPDRQPLQMVIINPDVVGIGHRTTVGMWEGCISCGQGNEILYGRTLRYKKITLRWQDEKAKAHEKELEGLLAHVAQHETDHLNGILFVDRVKDTTTYMMADEYQKRIVRSALQKQKERKKS